MRNIHKLITIFSLLFIWCLPVSSFAQGNTRLLIGLAGETPNERVQGIDIYTSEIDAALYHISSLPHVPINFGNNFTGDLAADAYTEYEGALNYIESELVNAINSSIFTVISINLESSPFHLELFQVYGNVGAKLGTFRLELTAQACKSPYGCAYFDVAIDDIVATAQYNVLTGEFENYAITYSEPYVHTTSQSLLIAVGRFFGVNNLPNDDTDASNDLRSMIEGEINAIGDTLEATQFFSLNDFLDSAQVYIENATLPTLPSILPPLTEADRNDALAALAIIRGFIGEATVQGSGTQLNFVINQPNYYNGFEQSLEIIASHVDTKITNFDYYTICGEVNYSAAPQSYFTKLYAKSNVFSNWDYIDSGFMGATLYLDNAQSGMHLAAIAKNSLIGNLYGYPSRLSNFVIDDIYSGTGGFQPIDDTIGECGDPGFGGGGSFP